MGREVIATKGGTLLDASQFVGNGGNGRIPNDRGSFKLRSKEK
jgi:hypothetical protein